MLKKLTIKNLTVFPSAELKFASGLNVIVGENGTGKSQILQVAYALIAASAERGKKQNGDAPTKSAMQLLYADKLRAVMRPDCLGRLVRRTDEKKGHDSCLVDAQFDDEALNLMFNFSPASKAEVQIQKLPQKWHARLPVFFPTRELMAIYNGFVSLYTDYRLSFEETYRDTCLLLGVPELQGEKASKAKKLLAPIEKVMGGKVVLGDNDRFYLETPKKGKVEMPLVAEGVRKLAMVVRLIGNGTLRDNGYLFWDEPESNLNPKLIKVIAEVILQLCKNGIQVFVTTHSFFLLRELEILAQSSEFKTIGKRFFALVNAGHEKGVVVEQDDTAENLDTLVLLDEELEQADRFLKLDDELEKSERRMKMDEG